MEQIDYMKFWSPAFDTMSEFVYLLDKNFTIIKANKAILSAKKKDAAYFQGRKCYEIIHETDEPIEECPHKRMLESKKFEMSEVFIPRQEKWLYIRTTPLFDDNNNLVGAIHLSADITKQKNVVQALKKSENDKLLILDNMVDLVAYQDTKNRILWANKATCISFGYTQDELKGKICYEAFHKLDKPCQNCPVTEAVKTGRFREREMFAPDGREWLIRGIPIKDEKEKVKGVLDIALDITRRKKAERALRESEEKFRNLTEQLPNQIFINKKGKIVYINKICEKIMGYSREEFYSPGFDFRKLIAPESRELVEKAFIRHMKGYNVPPYEYSLITKEGKRIEAILATKLITYEREKAILGIMTDITERKQIEHIKNTLIRDISHDLKTPVAIAEMAVDVFKAGLEFNKIDQIKKAYRIISENLKKLHKDIDNILELFALETKDNKILKKRKTKVSLKSVFDNIIKRSRYLLDKKKIGLEINIPQYANFVRAEKNDISVIMQNIIDNAIKFTNKGGIFVSGRIVKDYIEISIKDTGCGIEAKDISRVFDKFYKRHAAVEGSGLGLTICRELVEINKGQIEIESKGRNHGTTVIVRLPKNKKNN
ncbi:MAG: PAS domain-containing sensor histidine kinase [bacterium]